MTEEGDRRPRQNYLEMGLKVGDQLVFERLPDELVHVASEHRLHWRGHDISLTALKELLGSETGTASYSARILVNGRDLNALYDETYGIGHRSPRSALEAPSPTGSGLRFAEVVASPNALMGVKAVWGQSREPVMCFAARGDMIAKQDSYFSTARTTALLALEHPYLVTIGGGGRVPPELDGRVIELVRVTGVYGETSAFVHDEQVAQDLEQWPVAVVLADVFSVVGWPHLVDDLGFPDRKILLNAFDRVNRNEDNIAKLWSALEKRDLVYRRDINRLPGFRDPGEARLCQQFFPKLDMTSLEGQKFFKQSRIAERDPSLSRNAKDLNRKRNGNLIVCEGCDLADSDAGLFDAHHLNPIATGERQTHMEDFAILCPTCHRWAHRKGSDRLRPLTIPAVRAERLRQ